ncbi:exonuclease domain-containing protein [Parvimonas micra]
MDKIDLIDIKNKNLRGNEIIDFLDNYVIIDVETTGNSYSDDIIEISALRYKNYKLINSYSELVYSEKIAIFSKAYKKNNISFDMVKNAKKIYQVLEEFYDFINEDDVLIGHNVIYDIDRINEKLKHNGKYINNNFIDTMNISKRFDDFYNNSLDYLSEYFGFTNQKHRSYSDCLLCNQLYQKLKEKFLKEFYNLESFQNKKIDNKCKKINIIFDENEDENIFLYNKNICITGDVLIIVENLSNHYTIDKKFLEYFIECKGGICKKSVSKKTDYLILGDLSYWGNKSNNLEKAKNYGIEIIKLEDFFKMIEDKLMFKK